MFFVKKTFQLCMIIIMQNTKFKESWATLYKYVILRSSKYLDEQDIIFGSLNP